MGGMTEEDERVASWAVREGGTVVFLEGGVEAESWRRSACAIAWDGMG